MIEFDRTNFTNELYQMIDTSKELGLTQSYVHLWRWIQDDFTLFDFSNKCQLFYLNIVVIFQTWVHVGI